jgi:hypothetical protein
LSVTREEHFAYRCVRCRAAQHVQGIVACKEAVLRILTIVLASVGLSGCVSSSIADSASSDGVLLAASAPMALSTIADPPSSAEAPTSEQTVYACPMHPEITGVEGDRCSRCRMLLQPVEPDSNNEHNHAH